MLSGKIKTLLRGTITYAIGDFGTKILSFLIIPLYTHYISTYDMGVYDILISTVGLLQPIITIQIADAAYKWMISGEEETSICVNISYIIVLSNCILTMLTIAIINVVVSIPYCMYFKLLLIVSAWYTTIIKLIRGLHNQKLYAFIGLLYTTINLSLNMIQIVIFRQGIESLFISSIVAYVIGILVSILVESKLRKHVQTNRILSVSKKFISFSIPLIPNYLNWWLINSSDSYVVTIFLGASANGILSVAHRFPTILQTIFSLFNTAWQDFAVSEKKQDDNFYTEVFSAISSMMLGILLPLIPLTKIFIQMVMDSNYKISASYVPLYYLGAVYQGFSSFYGVGYLRNNKTSKAFITSMYAAVINLLLEIIVIRWMGLHAAAFSTFIGFFVMWIIREKQNRDELGIIVDWKKIIALTMLNLLVSALSVQVSSNVNVYLFIVNLFVFFLLNNKYFQMIVNIFKKQR